MPSAMRTPEIFFTPNIMTPPLPLMTALKYLYILARYNKSAKERPISILNRGFVLRIIKPFIKTGEHQTHWGFCRTNSCPASSLNSWLNPSISGIFSSWWRSKHSDWIDRFGIYDWHLAWPLVCVGGVGAWSIGEAGGWADAQAGVEHAHTCGANRQQ